MHEYQSVAASYAKHPEKLDASVNVTAPTMALSVAFRGGEQTCHPGSQRTDAFETRPLHAPLHAAMSGNFTTSKNPRRVPSQQPEPEILQPLSSLHVAEQPSP